MTQSESVQAPQDEQAARADLAAAFRWTARLGWHEAVANHFSLALNDSGAPFLVQPAGRHFARVRASELLKVDGDGRILDGAGALDPTAAGLHGALHRRVPGARCVLHTHMPYATALACLADGRLEPISQNALRFYERVAYDEAFSGMILDAGEGACLADLLGDNPVLVLRNRGVVVVGVVVAEAFDRLYYLSPGGPATIGRKSARSSTQKRPTTAPESLSRGRASRVSARPPGVAVPACQQEAVYGPRIDRLRRPRNRRLARAGSPHRARLGPGGLSDAGPRRP